MKEIEDNLKHFSKLKSLVPDDWSVEFFSLVFDILGDELLKVVEESRTKGKESRALNATFIALIMKSNTLSSFNDFTPISLCKLVYKIIAKVIANIIKPFLTAWFLNNRYIFDAIGVS